MTATLRVWPNIDRTGASLIVYAEDGVTIIPASGGAIVPYVQYYRDKLSAGILVDHDPLGLSGDPITIPPASSGATLWFATMAILAATPGATNRQQGLLLGYTTSGDGGEGTFYWDAASVEAANGGTIVGAFPSGRWKRVYERSAVHVDWFGAAHDSTTDALAKFQAAMDVVPVGGTLHLGPYTYVIRNMWDLHSGKNVQGCVGDGGGLLGGTIVRYLGPSVTTELGCAINAHQYSILKDFRVECGAGSVVTSGIGVVSDQWTSITFDNIGVSCWANSTSFFQNAYTVGSTTAVGGCDTLRWIRGFISDFPNAAILIQGSQPFDLLCIETNFSNFVAGYMGFPGGLQSFGTLLKTQGTYFGNITFENPNIGYVAVIVESPLDGMTNVTFKGGQCEGFKRLWWGVGNNASASCSFAMEGGRWNTNGVAKKVFNLDGSERIAAADRRMILSQQGSPITMRGVRIDSGLPSAVDATATFELNEYASFTADGCTFPNANVVSRINTFDYQSGGTYIRGCKYFTSTGPGGNVISPIPERHGPENADFLWTANPGAATTATVPLPQIEFGSGGSFAGGGVTDYLVYLYPHSYTGTPPAGAFKTRVAAAAGSIRKNGFDVEFDTAVGVGNTVTFCVRLQLRSDIP